MNNPISFPTIPGAVVIQRFGNWNPKLYANGRHMGVDIAGTVGTPILAACAGVVSLVHLTGAHGYGRHVIIEHGDFKTLYAHLHKVAVADGVAVEAGDLLGEMGGDPNDSDKIDGASTGPHLHFELLTDSLPDLDSIKTPYGYAVDPLAYLSKRFLPPPAYIGEVLEYTGVKIRTSPNEADKSNVIGAISFNARVEIAEKLPRAKSGVAWGRLRALRPEYVAIGEDSRVYIKLTPTQPAPQPEPTPPAEKATDETAARLDELDRAIAYLNERRRKINPNV